MSAAKKQTVRISTSGPGRERVGEGVKMVGRRKREKEALRFFYDEG